MPLSSKFFPESTGKKIVKIGQHLAKYGKRTTTYFFGPPCISKRKLMRVADKTDLDDLEVLHRFDGDVELNDAVVLAAADELAVDAVRRRDNTRRLVEREETTVVRRLLEYTEPQRLDRRLVITLREPEVVDEVADDAPRRQLFQNEVLENFAGCCKTGDQRQQQQQSTATGL